MLNIIRTDAQSEDFKNLVSSLDAYLKITDGNEHTFYDQYNQLTEIKYVVLAYEDQLAVGCGAIKPFENEVMEVKRMFTLDSHRGQGVAQQVLLHLEHWAMELGCKYCVLEAGKRQQEAISFYTKSGYEKIESYGQYIGLDNSQCFRKSLD